jgi:hypothetical protein
MRPGMNVGEMHIGPHRHLSLGQYRQLALGTAALQAGDAVKDFQNDPRSSTVGSTERGAQRGSLEKEPGAQPTSTRLPGEAGQPRESAPPQLRRCSAKTNGIYPTACRLLRANARTG